LPGEEPESGRNDTAIFDSGDAKPPLFDKRGRETTERPSRDREGRRRLGGGATVKKGSEAPSPFRAPRRSRRTPLEQAWIETVSRNHYEQGPHAVADARSAMRAETYYCPATAARTTDVPACRQLACKEQYWSGQRAYEINGAPAEVLHEAGRLLGAAKQASVEAWVEFHQPKDMARASLAPPVDLIVTRPRIFRCCSLCTGLYRWWMVPVQRTLGAHIAARRIREAHLADTRSKAQLTLSVHTGVPGDCAEGRRVNTSEWRDDRGEIGRHVKTLPNGRVQFLRNGLPAAGWSLSRQIVGKRHPYSTTRTLTFKTKPHRRYSQPIQKAAGPCYWEPRVWPTRDGAEIFGPLVFSRPSRVGRPKIGDLPLNNSQKSMRKRERAEYREILVPPGISDKAAVSSLAHVLAFFLFRQPTNHEVHHHHLEHRNQVHASPAQ
jgi:hypothetical protein